jgi:hypothetical protein
MEIVGMFTVCRVRTFYTLDARYVSDVIAFSQI